MILNLSAREGLLGKIQELEHLMMTRLMQIIGSHLVVMQVSPSLMGS
uniref:Uncharacterized protein n=1 Tax=Rhizophora mucronata TaxID=61149 RepID=A0A2P2KL93_RHIMU